MVDGSRNRPDDSGPDPAGSDELFARCAAWLRQARAEPGAATAPQLEKLAEQLQAALLAQPESVAALRLLAECRQLQGRLEQARALIEQALQRQPWNLELLIIAESLAGRQAAVRFDGRGQPASELQGWVVDPLRLAEQARATMQLGDLARAYNLAKLAWLLEPGKLALALDVLTIGCAADPGRTLEELKQLRLGGGAPESIHLLLGSACNVLGRYRQALHWLAGGLEQQPADDYLRAMLYNECAYVMVRLGQQLEQALALGRLALDAFPDPQHDGFIRDTLGAAYLKLDRIERARAELLQAVAKDDSVLCRFHLALVHLRSGEAAAALEQLRAVAASRSSLDSPHLEEQLVRRRVQQHLEAIERLLGIGGFGECSDVLELLGGLL